ncbi:hypothetical protein AB0K60_25705 [Thermopolyspora sp. NPDC052614]
MFAGSSDMPWAWPALPGSAHGLTVACVTGLIDVLTLTRVIISCR